MLLNIFGQLLGGAAQGAASSGGGGGGGGSLSSHSTFLSSYDPILSTIFAVKKRRELKKITREQEAESKRLLDESKTVKEAPIPPLMRQAQKQAQLETTQRSPEAAYQEQLREQSMKTRLGDVARTRPGLLPYMTERIYAGASRERQQAGVQNAAYRSGARKDYQNINWRLGLMQDELRKEKEAKRAALYGAAMQLKGASWANKMARWDIPFGGGSGAMGDMMQQIGSGNRGSKVSDAPTTTSSDALAFNRNYDSIGTINYRNIR